MINQTTMKGLDEALADLRRAIDAVDDDSLKKRLIKGYSRMESVREEMCENSGNAIRFHKVMIAVVFFCMIALIYLFFIQKSE